MYLFDADNAPVCTVTLADPAGYQTYVDQDLQVFDELPDTPIDAVFVDQGRVHRKTGMLVTVSATTIKTGETARLNRIPKGAVVTLDGVDTGWKRGALQLEGGSPETYTLIITHPHHLPFTLVVEVVAS